MKFEKASIEEALIAAAQEFGCSVVSLRYEVLQHPRKGIFGLFARQAIIEASAAEPAGTAGAAGAGAAGAAAAGAAGAKKPAQKASLAPAAEKAPEKPAQSAACKADKQARAQGAGQNRCDCAATKESTAQKTSAAAKEIGAAKEISAAKENAAQKAMEPCCAESSAANKSALKHSFASPAESWEKIPPLASEAELAAAGARSAAADEVAASNQAAKTSDGMRTHMQPPEPLSAEQIELCRAQIEQLLRLVAPVSVRAQQLECGALSIQIACDEPERLLGRDNFKFESLDLLINHYTNIAFSCHARVDVAGSLAAMRARLERTLERMRTQVQQTGRASSEPLPPTLLNIAYEELAREFAHKIINIKEAAAGRYICIWGRYDEHHRASSKRKH